MVVSVAARREIRAIAREAGYTARLEYEQWKLSPEGLEAEGDSVAYFGSDQFGEDRVDDLRYQLGVPLRTALYGALDRAFDQGFGEADAALHLASREQIAA